MASPNANFLDVGALAIENRSKKLANNFLESTVLLKKLKGKGKIKLESGGTKITREIVYQGLGNFKRYSGFEALDTSVRQTMTRAEYNWKQAAVAVPVSGLEMLQTGSPEAFMTMYGARMETAEQDLLQNLSADLYSLGTTTNQMGGLQAAVADAGTGTYGGIVSDTYTWWQNQYYDFSANTLTPGASTIEEAMLSLWTSQVVGGVEYPDFGVADNTYWRYYHDALSAKQRIMSVTDAETGFKALDYMGMPILLDGGLGGDCPSSHMYFLNSKWIEFVTHAKRNFTALDNKRFATNQDASINYIGWAGNLVLTGRRYQGAIVA